MTVKEEWLNYIKDNELKYLVIKLEEFLASISEEEAQDLLYLLDKYGSYRESLGKLKGNEYYVVNKDDVPHLKTKEEFFETVGYKVK
jgi:hypothetical protein